MNTLDQWEASANNIMMQGDVHEQGHAEQKLALLSEVRRLNERLQSAEEALRLAWGENRNPNIYIVMDAARKHFLKYSRKENE